LALATFPGRLLGNCRAAAYAFDWLACTAVGGCTISEPENMLRSDNKSADPLLLLSVSQRIDTFGLK